MMISVQYISGEVESFEVTPETRISDLKRWVKDARHWADDLEKDLTAVVFMANGQQLKDEDHLLDGTSLQVCFSIRQLECRSKEEAEQLGHPVGAIQVLKIPHGTSIPHRAFASCGCGVKKLVIPDSVTIIGDSAFQDCTELEAVTLPESLTKIGSKAFWGCKALRKLVIPDKVTIIETHSFYGCTGLTEVILPSYCEEIRDFAFEDCRALGEICIPETVSFIGPAAFRDCPLKTLKIPENVTFISDCLCQDCNSLESVEFPESLRTIGAASFEDCSSLSSVKIPSSVVRIEDCAFEGAAIQSVRVPKSSILVDAFPSSCTILRSDELLDSDGEVPAWQWSNMVKHGQTQLSQLEDSHQFGQKRHIRCTV